MKYLIAVVLAMAGGCSEPTIGDGANALEYKCLGGPPYNYADPQPGCCDVQMRPDMAAGAFPNGSYPSLLGPGYRLIDTIYYTNSIYGTYYTSVLNGGSCGFTACVEQPTQEQCGCTRP